MRINNSTYSWVVDRARSGEPVPIDYDHPDINYIIDYLRSIDGRGLILQMDTKAGILWVLQNEGVNFDRQQV